MTSGGRSFIERVEADAELARHLARWQRLRRQGWSVEVLQEISSGDVLAFGWRNVGAVVVEPDRLGQFELDVG